MDQTAITLCKENNAAADRSQHPPDRAPSRGGSRRARRHHRSMSTIPQILKDCRAPRWTRRSSSSKREFSSIRSGKASPIMLDTVRVEMYGQQMTLNQVASVVGARAARHHRDAVRQGADQGRSRRRFANPTSASSRRRRAAIIRVPLPMMNEQRRKELVKVVHKLAEEGRDRRSARAHARRATQLKKLNGVSEDDVKHAEKDLQKLHDDYIAQDRRPDEGTRKPRSWKSERGRAVQSTNAADLLAQIRVHGAVPRHVAIIMDGNGRWARERRMPRPFGHRSGMRAVREVVEGAVEVGLEVLSLFAFSQENWQRPADRDHRAHVAARGVHRARGGRAARSAASAFAR